MNLEKVNSNSSIKDLDQEALLSGFYEKIYSLKKHDSPDESRTSLVQRIKKLINEGEIFPNRVLDIGSGPQALEKQLLSRSQGGDSIRRGTSQFISVDLAKIMPVKLLSGKTKNVNHVQGNAINLPFKDKTFGLVVSNLAIDFCPQEEAFREAHRVLSDGGKGIFYLHHPSMLRRFPKDEEIRIFWQYLKDNSVLFSSEEEIKTFLEKVGFAPLEISLKSEKENLFLNNREKETWWEVMVEKI